MQMITAQQGQTMSSREIADLVESRHRDVCLCIERLMAAGAIKGYAATPYTHPQNNQQYMEYLVNQRDSYVIVAQLSPQFTARLVDRWQELESKVPTLPNFADPVAAARAWADAKEAEQKALADLAAAKPAVEFVERYVESTGSKGVREVAKLLGAKQNAFVSFLLERKVMYRLSGALTPYANHLDAGRFEVKTGVADNEHSFTSAKFTPKGVEWIAGLWAGRDL